MFAISLLLIQLGILLVSVFVRSLLQIAIKVDKSTKSFVFYQELIGPSSRKYPFLQLQCLIRLLYKLHVLLVDYLNEQVFNVLFQLFKLDLIMDAHLEIEVMVTPCCPFDHVVFNFWVVFEYLLEGLLFHFQSPDFAVGFDRAVTFAVMDDVFVANHGP